MDALITAVSQLSTTTTAKEDEYVRFFDVPKKSLSACVDDHIQLGILLIGRWEIVAKIEQVSYAQTYLAFDKKMGIYVAVKANRKKNVRLEREAMILDHVGNQVHFPEMIHYDGDYELQFIAMELMGATLEDIALQYRPLSLASIGNLGRQMIDTVQYFHSFGFLHNDIKSSNFAVGNIPTRQGKVYLTNYGFFCRYNSIKGVVYSPSKLFEIRVSDTYSSPFTLDGKPRCRRDDLYGILFVALDLRTELPWKHSRTPEEMREIMTEKIEDEIMKHFGREFLDFKRYLDSLTFFDVPDYDRCKNYFGRLRRDSKPKKKFEWQLDPEKLWRPQKVTVSKKNFERGTVFTFSPEHAFSEAAQNPPAENIPVVSSYNVLQEAQRIPEPIFHHSTIMPQQVIPRQQLARTSVSQNDIFNEIFTLLKPESTPTYDPTTHPAATVESSCELHQEPQEEIQTAKPQNVLQVITEKAPQDTSQDPLGQHTSSSRPQCDERDVAATLLLLSQGTSPSETEQHTSHIGPLTPPGSP